MKSISVPLLAIFISHTLAYWLPSCGWNDCMNGWPASSCKAGSGWNCLCNNATAISQINTCVATSCTNTTDQEAIYGAIAQICANNGVRVTNTQEATFSATSGGSVLTTITGSPRWGPNGQWGSAEWAAWVSTFSAAIGVAPSGWTGGPWGEWRTSGGPWGWPWATKADGVACTAWTTWTAGWGPYSSWTGTWSGCSTTTATPSPATVTRTVTSNGAVTVVTGTTFGVQAQAVAVTESGNLAAPTGHAVLGLAGGAAAALFGMMIAL